MSNQGQGLLSHFYLGFVCCVLILYEAEISGERLQDHWSSGFSVNGKTLKTSMEHRSETTRSAMLFFQVLPRQCSGVSRP